MTQPSLPPLPLLDGHLLIDNSTLELLRCPRLLEYQWLHRRVLAASKAGRNFGSTLHAGWAVRYNRCGSSAVTPEVVTEINAAMQAWLADNPQPEEDFRTYDHACRVMDAYNETYKDEGFKILVTSMGKLIVECAFALPLGEVVNPLANRLSPMLPIIYTGKIDMGIKNNEGIWSQDHKSAFQFGESFDKQMERDSGQLGYCWALGQVLNTQPTGYIIDAVRIRRPSKKGEYLGTPPVDSSDFKRMPKYVTPDDLENWRENVLKKISLILYMYADGFFPEYNHQCTNKFGMCDFYDVCSVGRTSRAAALASNMFEDSTWSPLNQITE